MRMMLKLAVITALLISQGAFAAKVEVEHYPVSTEIECIATVD